MNNSVKDSSGKIVGFRCFQCGQVSQSMWGTKCNSCRNAAHELAALRLEISRLTDVLESIKNKEEEK